MPEGFKPERLLISMTMDLQNLQTASHYLNNLLLARGLLRDATPLDFASPAAAKGGLESTMAKVISLVHDLVLRRDVSLSRQRRLDRVD